MEITIKDEEAYFYGYDMGQLYWKACVDNNGFKESIENIDFELECQYKEYDYEIFQLGWDKGINDIDSVILNQSDNAGL